MPEKCNNAELMAEYEARVAALARLVGRQALEIEFLKGAQHSGRTPRSGLHQGLPIARALNPAGM
ncbi:hypothetical protein [Tranquillimonas rosea]|uniref:hypothetical protein n=1 Tax=Tranquillimonas rosea TaxID=641238 RepID=UPI003BACE976